MRKQDCDKTLEAMFDEYEHEHSPWKKMALAWKIVLCTMFFQENHEESKM